MNTEGLKPIDARTMKPGDPCVDRDGLECRMLAYDPSGPLPNEHAAIRLPHGRIIGTTFDGRFTLESVPLFFLPPDPDPVDPSPGNVDKIRKIQVGEGWRIPAHDEKPDRRAEWWDRDKWNGGNIRPRKGVPYCTTSTYRVPIAPIKTVPLAMEDFAGKPWPLVKYRSGDCAWSIVSVHRDGVSLGGAAAFTSWFSLRYSYELSHDHGVTWVKAEKEELPQ